MLAESMIMEYTDIAGVKINYYIRSNDVEYDTLYGEHTGTTYEAPKETKIIYEVVDEPNLWSSFGMTGGDVITAHIPMSTWRRDVSKTVSPKIGDAVHIKWYQLANRSFEVCHVDDDDKTFQLKKMIWVLILRPFRYSEQSESAADIAVTSKLISAFGDNTWIEEHANVVDDIDTRIYGYVIAYLTLMGYPLLKMLMNYINNFVI